MTECRISAATLHPSKLTGDTSQVGGAQPPGPARQASARWALMGGRQLVSSAAEGGVPQHKTAAMSSVLQEFMLLCFQGLHALRTANSSPALKCVTLDCNGFRLCRS